MTGFDDPEFVRCTCHNRKLKPEEAVIFLRPDGGYYAFARDCPEHGCTIETSDQADVNQGQNI